MTSLPIHRSRPVPRPAFTLIEMLVSCAITSVLAVAMGSVIMLSARVMPRAKGATSSRGMELSTSRALEVVAEDLADAQQVTACWGDGITVVVPDRNANGTAETITYAWDGTKGGPLLRTYNGGTPTTVIDHLTSIVFAPQTIDRAVETTGAAVVGAETLLASYTGAAGTSEKVENGNWPATTVHVALPAGAVSYTVTRVELNISRVGLLVGADHLELRSAWPDGTPSRTVLATASMPSGILALSAGWRSYILSYSGSSVLRSRTLALVLAHDSGSSVLRVARTGNAVSGMRHSISDDGGVNWTVGDGAWNCRVYGTVSTTPTSTGTESRVAAIAIDAQASGVDAPMRLTVRVPSEPPAP